MVEVLYLSPGEKPPEADDDEPWLHIDASDDGRFFGSGWGRTPTGESSFYVSLAEDDDSLDAAIKAATAWAKTRGVTRIWVQREPWDLR